MEWSQLPARKQRLYIGLGVLVVAGLVGIASVSQKKDVGANSTGTASVPQLDSGFGSQTNTITIKTTQADAPVDAFLTATTLASPDDGTLGETSQGTGTLSLTDNCYKIEATDKNSSATGTAIVAVGSATNCGTGAASADAQTPVTIKLQ